MRTILAGDTEVKIEDTIESEEFTDSITIKRRFIVNPEFKCKIVNDGGVCIQDKTGHDVMHVRSKGAEFVLFSEGVYVYEDKRQTGELQGFDVLCDKKSMSSVHLEFKQ
tara:strand:- start:539 stop:865 length:327 start_codon:yes stop_codon:yes gene_type:complete